QRGEQWTDPKMEQWGPGDRPPRHLFAFYHQAVARQSGGDGFRRFRLAGDLCRAEAENNRRNVNYLLGCCFDLAAAGLEKERSGWQRARQEIEAFLGGDSAIDAHYRPAVTALPAAPCWEAAEAMLRAVPYI